METGGECAQTATEVGVDPIGLNPEMLRSVRIPKQAFGNPVAREVYDIRITPALVGFIVKVGCKTIVFETKEKLISELGRYFSDPTAVETEYLQKYSK